MSGRAIEKFPSVNRLAMALYSVTGLAKNMKFEIFGCLEALEDCR